MEELLKSGLTHVVDVDIKGYFDSIPHERLMALVRERIADSRVLKLIESFLKQRIMDPMGWIDPEEHDEGTPQGGVICQHFRRDHGWLSPLRSDCPLLANIYLNPLDHLMSQMGHEMVRYADDMVILCPSAEAAENVLLMLREWTIQAGLTLHPGKTKIDSAALHPFGAACRLSVSLRSAVDLGPPKAYFDFLGYRLWRSQKGGQLRRFIRPESIQKFKASIKPLTKRANGHSLEAIAKRLQPKLAGFYGYFKQASATTLSSGSGSGPRKAPRFNFS